MLPCYHRRNARIVLRMRLFLVLQVILLAFMVSYARSEEMRFGFDMGLYGGSVSGRGGINRDAGGGYRIATDISNGAIYGLRFGGTFHHYFGIEATLADAGTKYNAHLFDQSGDAVSGHENTSILLLSFNGSLQFPIGPVVPFVTAGVGRAVFMAPNDLPTRNYGTGVKIFLARHISLRGDVREYITEGDYVIDKAAIDPTFHFVPVYSFSDKIRLREISGALSACF